ncbi:hypothetical protein PPACK8108_LOCUS14434 [Phakopsora pachyrhizi]|uniref:Uncharacterized protein n=1 Tax=Phakopsora pachyrhizi TaxID=170000 RepID=A0AAV0B4J5_PHAPC|nr:hypothetical protein PPACK8108_LOCUS14434 [Phakopsora pachyrhizi]
MGLRAQNRLIKLLTGTGMRMKKQELNYITGSSNESTTRMNLGIYRPTNRNKKVGLNAGQTQWVVVTRGDLLAEVYPEEAQTDRLDYDLRGWEPVEYEYLKVYPAVNSESKISECTEDRDLIRISCFQPV